MPLPQGLEREVGRDGGREKVGVGKGDGARVVSELRGVFGD